MLTTSYHVLILSSLLYSCLASASIKPFFTEHPTSTYPQAHHQVTLMCKADGLPQPSITWYRNNHALPKLSSSTIPGSHRNITLSHLSILSFTKENEGSYYCVANNSLGSIKSKIAEVKIAYLQDNFFDPQSKTASIGETVLMECTPPSGEPTPKVSWLKEGEKLDTQKNRRLKVLEKGDLRIDKVQQDDSGEYTCVAENIASKKESQPATLKVREKPRFKVTPQNQEVNVNDDAVFRCQVTGESNTITWTRDNNQIVPDGRAILTEEKSLRIQSVRLSDAGSYICRAGSGSNYVEVVAKLTVLSPPEFVRTPEDQDVRVGKTAEMSCMAVGFPNPQIVWVHKDKHYLPQSDVDRIYVNRDGRIIIQDVRMSDAGRYECRASSYVGSTQSSAMLRVVDVNDHPPPVIELGPSNQTLALGSTVTFLCQARGTPRPTIYWYKNSHRIDIRASDNKRILQLTSGALQINVLKYGDSANYTCEAESGRRRTQWPARLDVVRHDQLSDNLNQGPTDVSQLPKPPDTIKLIDKSDTWMIVSWEPVSNVIGYRVEYAEYNGLLGWMWSVDKTDSLKWNISGLTPETGYRVLVRSLNEWGWGKPHIMDSILYTKVKQPLSTMKWDLVQLKMNDLIIRNIQLKSISTTAVKASWNVQGSHSEVKLITGFELKYKVIPLVRCLHRAREDSDVVDVGSDPVPQQWCSLKPEYKMHLEREMKEKRRLRIGSADSSSNSVTKRVIVNGNKRGQTTNFAVIEGLEPFTCYEVDVEPFADHSDYGKVNGRESPAETVLTFDGKPTEAPGDVAVKWISNTTVEIKWKQPGYEARNGVLTGYAVHIIGNGTRMSRNIEVAPNRDTLLVDHLTTDMPYTVHLASITCRGEGTRSKPAFLLPLNRNPDWYRGNKPGYNNSIINKPWFIGMLVAFGIVWLLLLLLVFILYRHCRKRSGRNDVPSKKKMGGMSSQPLVPPGSYSSHANAINLRDLPPHHKEEDYLQCVTNTANPIYSNESSSAGSRQQMSLKKHVLNQNFPGYPPDVAMMDHDNRHYDSSSGAASSQCNLPSTVTTTVAPYASTSILKNMKTSFPNPNCSTQPSSANSLSDNHSNCQAPLMMSNNTATAASSSRASSEDNRNHRYQPPNLSEMIPPPPAEAPPPLPSGADGFYASSSEALGMETSEGESLARPTFSARGNAPSGVLSGSYRATPPYQSDSSQTSGLVAGVPPLSSSRLLHTNSSDNNSIGQPPFSTHHTSNSNNSCSSHNSQPSYYSRSVAPVLPIQYDNHDGYLYNNNKSVPPLRGGPPLSNSVQDDSINQYDDMLDTENDDDSYSEGSTPSTSDDDLQTGPTDELLSPSSTINDEEEGAPFRPGAFHTAYQYPSQQYSGNKRNPSATSPIKRRHQRPRPQEDDYSTDGGPTYSQVQHNRRPRRHKHKLPHMTAYPPFSSQSHLPPGYTESPIV